MVSERAHQGYFVALPGELSGRSRYCLSPKGEFIGCSEMNLAVQKYPCNANAGTIQPPVQTQATSATYLSPPPRTRYRVTWLESRASRALIRFCWALYRERWESSTCR